MSAFSFGCAVGHVGLYIRFLATMSSPILPVPGLDNTEPNTSCLSLELRTSRLQESSRKTKQLQYLRRFESRHVLGRAGFFLQSS